MEPEVSADSLIFSQEEPYFETIWLRYLFEPSLNAAKTVPNPANDLLDVSEALTGRDTVSGEKLTGWRYGLTVAGAILPIVSSRWMRLLDDVPTNQADELLDGTTHVHGVPSRPIDVPPLAKIAKTDARTWQEYEAAIRALYGEASVSSRRYTALVDGKLVSGVADNVTTIGGRTVAIEAKFVNDWASSLRNPASAVGTRAFAIAEQAEMLAQAKKYSAAFDEVIYHSNSAELIAYYTRVFRNAGITNFRFILTP